MIGYLMDVLGLRVLLLVDNAIRGLLMVGLAAVVHTGHARLGYLVVFAILSALLSPATELGQNVAVPTLLESSELDAANRLLSASSDIAAWIGHAIAGVGIDLLGSAAVLLVDASTFFAMALVALTMPGRADRDEAAQAEQPGSVLGRLLSGFRILWQLRPVAIMTALP